MEAKERSIQEIFCDGRMLTIPFFQRTYTWDVENWKRFNNDMMNLLDLDESHKYFLGALILKTDDITEQERYDYISSKYTVIDGQQRLTTLTIYLKALINKIADERALANFNNLFVFKDSNDVSHPKLSHSFNDRDAYKDIIIDGGRTPHARYKSERVINAFTYFRDQFQECDTQKLRRLLIKIYSNITFVGISLDRNDDEQQIFDTINSLGVKLTIDELMKNFLYDSVNEREWKENWCPVFDTEDAIKFWRQNDAAVSQAASDKNTVICNFFHDFVRIKMWEFAGRPGFNKDYFVKKEWVLETCKAFVERFGVNKQELANEIIEYAKLYRTYFDKNNLNKPILKHPSIERIAFISMVHNRAVRPYLLYILRNVDNESSRNDIFGFLEVYIVRRAICKLENKQSEIWTEQLIRQDIKTVEALRGHIIGMNDTNNYMPSNKEILSSITQNNFDAKMVLYLIESKLNNKIFGYNFYSDCQIIPAPSVKNKDSYPPHNDEESERLRKQRIKTIGNYLLLSLGEFAQDAEDVAKNLKRNQHKRFDDKKSSLLQYTANVSCMQWYQNQKRWDEHDIDERNKTLAKYINDHFWKLEQQ